MSTPVQVGEHYWLLSESLPLSLSLDISRVVSRGLYAYLLLQRVRWNHRYRNVVLAFAVILARAVRD